MTDQPAISKNRLFIGAAVLIIGFCGPLFIPIVTSSGLSVGLKTTLSGLLAFGIPEVFMLIAIGILGKDGYSFLKAKLSRIITRISPDEVSLSRHRLGVFLFATPILIGFIQPYLGHYFDFFREVPLWFYITGDAVFIISIFILGGRFWDKLQGLFRYH